MLYSFVQAVRQTSLASTYSIFMFAPLLVAALSAPLLRERVAGAQWAAIGAGFLGVLVMLRPSADTLVARGALWALVAVVTYAFSVVTLRLLARTDSNESMVFWFTAMLAVGAGLMSLPAWRDIQWGDLPLMLGVGICGALGQHFITVAFRSAPAAVIAPFEYTALLWGVLLDIAIWHAVPGAVTVLGGSIVIGAGLYLIQRERRQVRTAAGTSA